jgi:hypothetical protein
MTPKESYPACVPVGAVAVDDVTKRCFLRPEGCPRQRNKRASGANAFRVAVDHLLLFTRESHQRYTGLECEFDAE